MGGLGVRGPLRRGSPPPPLALLPLPRLRSRGSVGGDMDLRGSGGVRGGRALFAGFNFLSYEGDRGSSRFLFRF